MDRRWTFDHVIAVLELACAVFVVAWMTALGVEASATAGRTPLDRAFPFLVALVVGAVLLRWSVRSWRAGNRAAAAAPPEPADEPAAPDRPLSEPQAPPDPGTPLGPLARAPGRQAPPDPQAPLDPENGPAPAPLSPHAERELARVVAVLADAGVFAPRVPEPEELRAPVADHGEPVTAWSVLMALHEADFYRAGFEMAAYSARLAFHDSHTEQFVDVVESHVDDLVRLAGGGLDDVSATVTLTDRDGAARVPTTVRLGLRDGERVLAYDGAGKYLSTVVHVALAGILRERATGRRLAWLWSDQGVWLCCLPDGTIDQLNAALGPAADEGWEWVDEQEPVAAGDIYPP